MSIMAGVLRDSCLPSCGELGSTSREQDGNAATWVTFVQAGSTRDVGEIEDSLIL